MNWPLHASNFRPNTLMTEWAVWWPMEYIQWGYLCSCRVTFVRYYIRECVNIPHYFEIVRPSEFAQKMIRVGCMWSIQTLDTVKSIISLFFYFLRFIHDLLIERKLKTQQNIVKWCVQNPWNIANWFNVYWQH